MSGFEKNSDLFPEAHNPQNVRPINNRCLLRSQEDHTVVIVSGVILAQFTSVDQMAQAHAMVSLVEQGLADQLEVAQAFDCSTRTVRRYQQRFADGGLPALGRPEGYPLGRSRLSESRAKRIKGLKARGCSCREIASILGVTERAVRKVLHRLGVDTSRGHQPELSLGAETGADPNLSAFATTTPSSKRSSPADNGDSRLADCPSPPVDLAPATAIKGADPNLSAFATTTPSSKPSLLADNGDSSPADCPLPAVDLAPATAIEGADPSLSAFGATRDTDPTNRSGDRLLASLGLMMRNLSLAAPQTFFGLVSCWPSQPWFKAASLLAPRKSMAA